MTVSPRFEQRKVDGHVGLCAGVGLHVGVLGAKQLAGAVDGDLLHLVHILAAAVVAVAGVALGILVGQHAAHGCHHGGGNNVLARRSAQCSGAGGPARGPWPRPVRGQPALHSQWYRSCPYTYPLPPVFRAVACGRCCPFPLYNEQTLQRALGGKHPVDPCILACGGVQRLGKRLEHSLQLVVVVLTVQYL